MLEGRDVDGLMDDEALLCAGYGVIVRKGSANSLVDFRTISAVVTEDLYGSLKIMCY